jgi:hypothetical protein
LNPDFLVIRNIVREEWGWEVVEPRITTPPFALVRYANGVSITVEYDKLQVVDTTVSDDPLSSKACEIARNYITTLPHVRYTAVGMNFQSVVETPAPEAYLKERFLKAGPWQSERNPLDAAGFRFVYLLLGNGRVTVSIDAGEIEPTPPTEGERQKRRVIVATANFHRVCEGYPADSQAVEHLERMRDDWSVYQQFLQETLLREV